MTPMDSATGYIRRGLYVFPCHALVGGLCSCGKPDCSNVGKHPRTARGLLDATTDPARCEQWRRMWPDANVALATGEASRVDVLDIDIEHGGHFTLANLEDRHGLLPQTWRVRTGSGGQHVFFQHWPGLRNSAGRIGPGLDVRADGGYVILPPSLHSSGGRYEWMATPGSVPLAPWPTWLAAMAQPVTLRPSAPTCATAVGGRTVPPGLHRFAEAGAPEGQRNATGFWLACRLVQEAGNTSEARRCLDVFASACRPPLVPGEVDKIWRSAVRSQPFAPHELIRRRCAGQGIVVGTPRPAVGMIDASGPARPPRWGRVL
jgi:hypothetical protein